MGAKGRHNIKKPKKVKKSEISEKGGEKRC